MKKIIMSLCILISISSNAQKKWEDYGLKLFKEKKDNLTLMGLKKADGLVVLAPKYVLIGEEIKGGYAVTAQPKGDILTDEEIIKQGKSRTLEILCGIIDSTGKVVIEPFATTIDLPFKGNITTVTLSDKGLTNTRSNLLTKQGKLLSVEYSPVFYNLEDDYFVVYSKNGLKSGLVNSEGMFILPLEYDAIQYENTENGDFARVVKAKKYGLYSIKDKKMIIPNAYDFLVIPDGRFPLVEVANAGKNGMYDISKNKLILPCTFTGELTPEYYTTADNKQKLGYFTVKNTDTKTYRTTYGLIDVNGKILLENKFDEILPLQQTSEYTIGYVKIINEKKELIDGLNEEVLIGYFVIDHKNIAFKKAPMKFGYFTMGQTHNTALVTDYKADGMGLINCLTDKYVVEPTLRYARGLFRTNYFSCQKDGKPGILDFSGKEIVPFGQYDEIVESSYRDTIMVLNVRKNGKWGCIEPSGKIILQLQYDKEVLYNDKMWVSKNGYWGCIDNNQKQLIEFKFDTATYREFKFNDNGITCYESIRLIKIDNNGNILTPKTRGGYANICEAIYAGANEAIKEFLADGVDFNKKYGYSRKNVPGYSSNPMELLWLEGNDNLYDIVKLFIENGWDVNSVMFYDNGNLLFNIALGCNYSEDRYNIAKLLIDNNANVNFRNPRNNTPLHDLCVNNVCGDGKMDLMIAKLLIDNGADVKAVNNLGETPLQLAKKNKKGSDFIDLLKKAEKKK